MTEIIEKGRLLGQGRTAEIFEWNHDCVLKLYREDMPENLCRQEFEWTGLVYENVKVAPKPIQMISLDGRNGAIYERLSGETMLTVMNRTPWRAKKFAKKLAKSHIDLHKIVDIEAIPVKEKLARDIENAGLLSSEEKRKVIDYLHTLPDGKSICHFDFHPDNIMISDGYCRVIDWMTACVGDPLSDVARTGLLLIYAEPPDGHTPSSIFAGASRRLFFRLYKSEYLKRTGSKNADIKRWEIPVAAARLCEGVPETELNRVYLLLQKLMDRERL
jgi:hypothetical protein